MRVAADYQSPDPFLAICICSSAERVRCELSHMGKSLATHILHR